MPREVHYKFSFSVFIDIKGIPSPFLIMVGTVVFCGNRVSSSEDSEISLLNTRMASIKAHNNEVNIVATVAKIPLFCLGGGRGGN